MSLKDLSESTQDYLKAVYRVGEWSDEPVTTTKVAARVGVKLSTASDAIRRLTDQGLLHHERYGAISLTEQGQHYAVAMVRRHRLIETFLVEILGYGWDEVHDEAEMLEHSVSDLMIERLDALLKFPRRDPHGDPIPTPEGGVDFPDAIQLSDARAGQQVRVERVSDDDPELLQHVFEHGLRCGALLDVQSEAPYSDTITLVVEGRAAPFALGRRAAASVWVSEVTRAKTQKR